MTEKLNAILVMEILGKPPEYIKETMIKIIEDIGNSKDVKLISKTVAEPKQIEQDGKKQDAYTTFAEIEIETTIQQLMRLIFTYTPSHIDIIKPDTLEIKNFDLNSFFNELIVKMHQYDEIARAMLIEKQIIANKMQELNQNIPNKTNKAKVKKSRKKKS